MSTTRTWDPFAPRSPGGEPTRAAPGDVEPAGDHTEPEPGVGVDALGDMRKADLIDLAGKLGLDTSGVKADLTGRIRQAQQQA